MDVVFGQPEALFLLWGLIPLALLLVHARRRRARAGAAFLAPEMARRLLPVETAASARVAPALLLLGFACFSVALARPRFGVYFEKVAQRGADLVVILDVSRSMLSEDVHPNRLERSKAYVRDLLERLRGDRVGLIAFAGKPVQVCPLTTDQAFFESALAELGPDSAPRGGTAIGDAIRSGIDLLDAAPDRDRAFVLITDGEDQDSFPLEAAAAAAEQGVKIFTVGIGDPGEGARIPVAGGGGAATFMKHEGREVWSKMDESLLEDVALKTGGAYVPARTGTYDLGAVYEEHLSELRAGDLQLEKRKRYREQFQWFVAAGLAAWLGAELLRGRRAVRGTAAAAAAALVLLLALPAGARAEDGAPPASAPAAAPEPPAPAQAEDPRRAAEVLNEAVDRLDAGALDAALPLFEEASRLAPRQPIVSYGHGVALQRKGDLDAAEARYGAAASAGDARAAARARYNLGTLAVERAKAALGERPEDADREARTRALEAIDGGAAEFRTALELDPADQDARYNLELLRVWKKHIQDEWKRKDKEQERKDQDLLQLLDGIWKAQRKLRASASALDAEGASPRQREALAELAAGQRELKLDALAVGPKIDEALAAAGTQPAGAAAAGGAAAPAGPTPEQLEEAKQGLHAALDELALAMDAAAGALDRGDAGAAEPEQARAVGGLSDLWLAFATFEPLLKRMIELEQGVVEGTEPLAEAAPSASAPAAPLPPLALGEDQGQVGELAPILVERASAAAPEADAMLAAAEQAEAALAAEGPASQPAASQPAASQPGSGDPAAQVAAMKQRAEGLKQALSKAAANGPLIPPLAEQAVADLGGGRVQDALRGEQEILRLLKEIAESLRQQDPKDEQKQDQPQEDQEKQDQEKEDQEKQDGDSEQKPEEQPDPKDPKDDSNKQDEKPPMTQQQMQKLLQQALAREKEYKDKKKALQQALAVPVPVERDW